MFLINPDTEGGSYELHSEHIPRIQLVGTSRLRHSSLATTAESGDLSAFGGSRSAGLQGALTLRYANLPTTQLYLRKICGTKAMRWIMK